MKFAVRARQVIVASAALVTLAVAPRAGAAGWQPTDAAVSDAEAVAAQRPGLTVMRVAGQSMLPYFNENAVIVIKKIDAARLRVGMIAVYVNRFGEKVAHRVVAKIGSGWEVKGYNNDRADSTVVDSSNLLGVVYATFDATARTSARLAAENHSSVETVYAAPAK